MPLESKVAVVVASVEWWCLGPCHFAGQAAPKPVSFPLECL